MFYHTGNSQHTQNIQTNKVIGEKEKCVFYFTKKTKWNFWPTHYKEAEQCENEVAVTTIITAFRYFTCIIYFYLI